MFTVQAMIHSLKALDEATILSVKDNNNVVAEYKGVKCTAIFNVFNGLYYVDNVYGIINDTSYGQENMN